MSENPPLVLAACKPRPDVLTGGLTDAHFAAQLDRIVRAPQDYPAYGDPSAFFELTYPTQGLKELLRRTFGRLSGAKVHGAEHGLIRSETSFGGGKTHGLIAAYHLAKGARPQNLAEFIAPDLLPNSCQIAALVGDQLDPVNGTTTNGRTTYTLWGEIGAQLGDRAYAVLEASDKQRTAPSTETLARAFGDTPTIVIIDEIAQYLRQLTSAGNEDVRRLAKALPVFLKNLLELAAGDSKLVVILTLATSLDAFNSETGELDALMREAQANLEGAGRETASVVGRFTGGGSIVRPAEDVEVGEILKRRLFESIDSQVASEVASAFEELYEGLTRKGEQLPDGADKPAQYAKRIATTYPFHPELIRVLDQRLGTIPNFQRTRGALRLLAEAVSGLWGARAEVPIINVGDLRYEHEGVLNHLTSGLGRGEFDAVARSDFVGQNSYAANIDRGRMVGKQAITRRAAGTVFAHSLELTSNTGAARQDIVLGTLRPAESADLVIEALNALDETAWFLSYENNRYRFRTEPNPNAIIAAAEQNFTKAKVNESMAQRIIEAFPTDKPVNVVHFPVGFQDVPDHPRQFRLAILHYDALSTRSGAQTPSALVEILNKTGAAGGVRVNRNGVAFLVADEDELQRFEHQVRRDLAAQSIVDDTPRMQEFSDSVRKRVQSIADTSKLEARIALSRCYRHLFIPRADRSSGFLGHEELPPQTQGTVKQAQTRVLLERLRDIDKVRTADFGTDYLLAKAWRNQDQGRISTDEIMAVFWQDHSLPMILDPVLLQNVVKKGIESGRWVYYDAESKATVTAKDPPAAVRISEETYLYTPEQAQAEGLLAKPVRANDVTEIVSKHKTISGPELRAKLEQRVGAEPAKGEVLQVLSSAATGGESARLFVVRGDPVAGEKPLAPSEITKVGLDSLTILTKEAAEAAGLDLGRRATGPRPVEATGAIGQAYQSVLNQVEDASWECGIRMIEVTARAEIETGIKPIRELHQAITMLPNFDVNVDLELDLAFDPLSGEASLKVSGTAAELQRVEDAIFGITAKATELLGRMTLRVNFDPAIPVDHDRVEKLRRALTTQQPGEVVVRATP